MASIDLDSLMEARLPALRQLMPNVPERSCLDTCRLLFGDLQATHEEPLEEVQGWFGDPEAEMYSKGHAGVRCGDTMIEPTIGQFLGGRAWQVVTPESSVRGWYLPSTERLWE